jgi:glutamyl-tRNA reductase
VLNNFHIIAFTHRNLGVSEIGKLHIEADNQQEALTNLKTEMQLEELMFLSTCNRVEFIFVTEKTPDFHFLQAFFSNTLSEFYT